ncbi:MAG TPA: GreA/GreB family elongation factor [Mycobacteriales bacterium]|jgi:transcription elongation factor GreA|nr:GreA/GreB family elongation factor [Mycobacteriales bacterium]
MTIVTTHEPGLEAELAALRERAALLRLSAVTCSGDAADQAERVHLEWEAEQIDLRIERLRDRIDAVAYAAQTPADGTARLGAIVELDFADGGSSQFQLGEVADLAGLVSAVSTASPLGAALLGARAGDTVTYGAPRGRITARVTAVR